MQEFLTKKIERFLDCIADDWVLQMRQQGISHNAHFQFRQCGTHFIKDGKEYTLKVRDLCSQAKKANINYYGDLSIGDKTGSCF